MIVYKKRTAAHALGDMFRYTYIAHRDAWMTPEGVEISRQLLDDLPGYIADLEDGRVAFLTRELVILLYEWLELNDSEEVLGELMSSL